MEREITTALLSRRSLARVVTSLLKNELKAAGSANGTGARAWMTSDAWPETLPMAGTGVSALPCDSLDLLRLGAAVNEMFHLHEVGQELGLLSVPTFGEWLDRIEAAWRSGIEQITFVSSGSTGRPHRCTHTFSHLQTEIEFLGKLFADRTRIVPLTPAHHIYGFLFTAMLPDHLGCELHVLEDAGGTRVAQTVRPGDLVISFPDRWQWLCRTIPQWPSGVAGVVSTAPCPADLGTELLERGLESLTEVYGSSETAGLGLRRWPALQYHFMPHWTVRSDDAEGVLLRHSSGIQVRVKDHLALHEGGGFTLAGRLDAAVQVGGLNVYPKRIAALLRSQPGVRDASVRLSGWEEGGRLKAFIVPEPLVPTAALQTQLEAWMQTALSPAEQPKSITFGGTLPKSDMGKDGDW